MVIQKTLQNKDKNKPRPNGKQPGKLTHSHQPKPEWFNSPLQSQIKCIFMKAMSCAGAQNVEEILKENRPAPTYHMSTKTLFNASANQMNKHKPTRQLVYKAIPKIKLNRYQYYSI
jgi:hypothetical protein